MFRIISKGFEFVKPTLILGLFIGVAYLLHRKGLLNCLTIFNHGFRLGDGVSETLEIYRHTGQILLRHAAGITGGSLNEIYSPIENKGDDPGIYFFLPYFANVFPSSYDLVKLDILFFGFITLIGYLISCIGFNLLIVNQELLVKTYFYTGVSALFSFFILDVYIWAYFITCFVPLFIWLVNSAGKSGFKRFYIFMFVFGILAGLSNQFRNYSGTGMIVFVLSYLALNYSKDFKIWKIVTLALLLISSSCIPGLFLQQQYNQRDNWLSRNEPSFKPVDDRIGHVVWHNIYLGLGFIKNPYGIIWDDQFAFDKVDQLNPDPKLRHCSIEYERILKTEYLKILRNNFGFVVRSYFVKFVYASLFLLLFFNYGFILLFRAVLSYRFLMPFFITICFYSLPAVLVWPFPMYFLGAINLVVILFVFLLWKQKSEKQFV
jgi:hypothetical protein